MFLHLCDVWMTVKLISGLFSRWSQPQRCERPVACRIRAHAHKTGLTCVQAMTWTLRNLECGDLAAGRHAMLSAGAAHLHDKGLVNYLKILIWSIQESCIRLHGQSEPPDSIGLHYSWEPQKWTGWVGGAGREGARDKEQQQRLQGLVSCVLKVFLLQRWWIFHRVWNSDGAISLTQSRGEGLGGNTAAAPVLRPGESRWAWKMPWAFSYCQYCDTWCMSGFSQPVLINVCMFLCMCLRIVTGILIHSSISKRYIQK